MKKVSKKKCLKSFGPGQMSRFDVSYDAICSLCRLFEKEVELFRMIAKLIRKVTISISKKS